MEIVSLRMGLPSACSRQEATAFRPEAVGRQHLRPIHCIFNRSANGAPPGTGSELRLLAGGKEVREWKNVAEETDNPFGFFNCNWRPSPQLKKSNALGRRPGVGAR
jgi:hypothetical protein